MGGLDVCLAEDAIRAFLDYLVEPLLPSKSFVRDTPSVSQLKSVAKQVHAVVLLYNYYHRKQHPQLGFEDFDSFCKLAVILKPNLLAHMKLMQNSNGSELDDQEKQLSYSEKAVMDACDIAMSLDASKDAPSTKQWPISKVSVFLIDSKKENCLLQFCSITEGVWSAIEKEMDVPNDDSKGKMEEKQTNKKKRVTRRLPIDESGADVVGFQQVAFSAVKDAAGIKQSDLAIIESHVIYSLSKEKTTTCFCIMQSTQPSNDDAIQMPIKDAIESLQGPLVKKTHSGWIVAPVVEYFHLLPYARVLSDWLFRNAFSSSLQEQKTSLGNLNVNSSEGTEKALLSSLEEQRTGSGNLKANSCEGAEKPCEPPVHDNEHKHLTGGGKVKNLVSRMSSTYIGSLKQEDDNGCSENGLLDLFDGPQNMDVDDSSIICVKRKEECNNCANNKENHKKMMTPCLNDLNTSTSCVKLGKVISKMSGIDEVRGENIANENEIRGNILSGQDSMPAVDHSLVPHSPNCRGLEKLQTTIASKETVLSQTALKVLLKKRDKLIFEQRNIEDEIAQCDKKIQIILNGGEDDLGVMIDSIIEGCNDACLRNISQARAPQHLEDQCSSRYLKGKRLSDAVLNMRNPCQELDGLCYENNWMLPTYRLSPSDGGFQAKVTVEGMDEYSSGGQLCPNPREARESAAAEMLLKLHSRASKGL